MQRLEVSGAVRPIYGSLGVKPLMMYKDTLISQDTAAMTTGTTLADTSKCRLLLPDSCLLIRA